jgi:ubiquinone/menaquinone biosynthesis C-methylase UbiE
MGFYAEKMFPHFLDVAMRGDEMNALRAKTLSYAHGRVLEIGFGTGMNARHYPSGVKQLVVIDNNPGMSRLAHERLERANLNAEHRVMSGERLPFRDNEFDNVIVTFTLCSIEDVSSALNETRRVLKHGGELLFLEHNLADHVTARRAQRALTPLWKHVAGGCHLDRDAPALISASGLHIVEVEHSKLASGAIFGTIRRGRAQKE